MEISDDEREYPGRHATAKRSRYDNENLKDENDALRCQLEAIRNEMSMERTDLRYDSVQREKQIKVLQETIRNMQTQLLQSKMREQKDARTIEQLERSVREAGGPSRRNAVEINEICIEDDDVDEPTESECGRKQRNDHKTQEVIEIDVYKDDDDVRIIEHQSGIVEIHEIEDDEKAEAKEAAEQVKTIEVDQTIAEEDAKVPAEGRGQETADVATSVLGKAELEFKSLALIEAKIIALTAAYLVLHPHGVSLVRISAYLRELISASTMQLETSYLEDILRKYKNIFRAETDTKVATIQMQYSTSATDVGTSGACNATITTKWSFCGFTESATDQKLDEK